MKVSVKQVKNKLSEVLDPELNIPVTDLGLVYDVKVQKDKVRILMTLTTIGCPLFSLIEQDVKSKLQKLGLEEKDIELKLTFDPPWSIERLSELAKAKLGI